MIHDGRAHRRFFCASVPVVACCALLMALAAAPAASAQSIVSDDFSTGSLNTGLWTFVNPVGDGAVSVSANALRISVPSGATHDVWSGNRSARVMQAAADEDFTVEVKFASPLTQLYQMQGVLIEQDPANYLRFDFYSDGTGLYAFAASFVSATPTVRGNIRIPTGVPLYMRVSRVANQWSQWYSYDGSSWHLAGSFSHTLQVSSAGVFAANAGALPAHTAVIDYFFNTASPIDPEDNGTFTLQTQTVGQGQITVVPSRTVYAAGEQIEMSAVAAAGWSFSGWTGLAGAGDASPTTVVVDRDLAVTATFVMGDGIDVWHGTSQTFGQLGVPQTAFNIPGTLSLGNAPSLSYRLNGGPVRPLAIGPDLSRLDRPGDFNIDVPVHELVPGINQVVINATNVIGTALQRTVRVDYRAGNVWPLPYAIDWNDVTNVTDVSLVVDGKWQVENGTVRTAEPGYDRLLAIGDLSWGSYEATVPVTIHSMHFLAHNPPLVGLFPTWRGHHVDQRPQPPDGWWQSGALGYYRWFSADNSEARLDLLSAVDGGLVSDPTFRMQMGTEYVFKVRSVLTSADSRQYSLKVWRQGTPEPAGWPLTINGPEVPPGGGSLMLVAHYVDASFGAVSIVPIEVSSTPPPVISNVAVSQVTSSRARITWTTDVPSTTAVSYGRTSAYEAGTSSDTSLTTSHAVDLTGLLAETHYFFRVASTGPTGSRANLAGFSFDTVVGGAPTPIVSDDFSAAALNTAVWTFVNPRNDATLRMTGTQAVIDVPGGVAHDVWVGGAQAPRLMQATANTDFVIETKFESAVSAVYQLQGLLVEQDAGAMIRFDAHWDGGGTTLFAATIGGGTVTTRFTGRITPNPHTYLRLERTGNQWTVSYSVDGSGWTTAATFVHQLDVRAVGVFAGNAGAAPAHSAVIDYFFNSAAPILAEDERRFAIDVGITGQGQVVRSPAAPDYPAGQAVQLTATPAAGWAFSGWSGDLSGSSPQATLVVSGNHSVSALFTVAADSTAPTISGVQATAARTEATITWTTDEPATSSVSYGESAAYELGTMTEPSLRTSHSVRLTGLTPGTAYRYRAASADAAGNLTQAPGAVFSTNSPGVVTSDDFSAATLDGALWRFVNPRQDASVRTTGIQLVIDVPAGVAHDLWTGANHAPRVTQVVANADFSIEAKFESLLSAAHQLQGLIVEQDVNRFLRFDTYSDASTGVWLFAATFDGVAPTVRVNRAIAPGPAYLRIQRAGDHWTLLHSGDGADWQTVASFSYVLNAAAAGVFAGNAGHAPAHSAVIDYFFDVGAPIAPEDGGRYVLETLVQGQGTVSRFPNALSFGAGEQVQLAAVPAPGWRFVGWGGDVTGTNADATLTVSREHRVTATFAVVSDTAAPVMSNRQVTQVTSSGATVSWTTNEPATSMVRFGETSAYERGAVQDHTVRTTHSVRLEGLTRDSTYHYAVSSTDIAGNVGTATDAVFTTLPGTAGIVSDDFTGPTLNTGLWSVVDPRQDATVRMTGAQVAIDVPGGISHDVWSHGNLAPRLVQRIDNADFVIQAKFDSAVTQAYQMQGLIVEQDGANFVRYDVYFDGAGTSLFAATFTSGEPTVRQAARVPSGRLHLRLARAGNTWILSYSTDGATWQPAGSFSHAMRVTAAGVFAGNAEAAPAHTAVIDYVLNPAAPVTPGN